MSGCSNESETAIASRDFQNSQLVENDEKEMAMSIDDQFEASIEEEEAVGDEPVEEFSLDMEDQISDMSLAKKLTINNEFKKFESPTLPSATRPILKPNVRPTQKSNLASSTRPNRQAKVLKSSTKKSSAFGGASLSTEFSKQELRTSESPTRQNEPQAMAVMAPAEIESDLPPSQTNIEVFYATDRQSKFGIAPNDWLNIHLGALISLAIYLITFAAVFLTQRKALYGMIAFGSLVIFLVLGQSANVTWQKQKRLASHNDPIYLSDIRPAFSDDVLDFGVCNITIPPNHKVGQLDTPTLFKLEFSEDPESHVVLNRVVKSADKNDFYRQLNESIDQAGSDQALVFVHGYNVSFENAVKRTAQIAHDLKFDGAPICYSWSSHGALANYTKDMANADATVITLQSFLEETVQRTGKTTIHLVAHSMGNRAMLQALDRMAISNVNGNNDPANEEKMFGQLVMAAPDVSVGDFRNRFAPSAMKLANSVTLYASSRDRALLASTKIHGHNRAGLAGENLVVMDGLDTIDVSEIDTSLIGHSYYGDHPELIKDLRALVELSQPAANRKWLTRIFKPGTSTDYFRFTQRESKAQIESEFK